MLPGLKKAIRTHDNGHSYRQKYIPYKYIYIIRMLMGRIKDGHKKATILLPWLHLLTPSTIMNKQKLRSLSPMQLP